MGQFLLIGVAIFFLQGCAGSDDEAETDIETEPETVFDPLVETMDRAQDVQRIVDEQAEEMRRRLEEAEGGAR